jgi:phytoene/squalene synthetase
VQWLNDIVTNALIHEQELCFSVNQDFKYEENTEKAVQCLNDIVTNALIHAEECLQYMSALKNHAIFRFCAIPQVNNLFNFFVY